ncbi:MAG: gliding motility-associated C-terminal domain-containing protein [Bacteroidales bacterium]|nr:gliding motility-associated C-terminal domain-containing protein [Bacteroidales bacterium]
MKTVFSFTILILIFFRLHAQTLEIPRIISVSVDTITGYPIVNWTINEPEEADGFIVKKLIVGGQGVISGTFNNIAVVSDNSVFSYLDDKESFGTKAEPQNRKEFYSISSYKTDESGHQRLSLMSEAVSTQTLSGDFDYCTNTFNFQFSANQESGAKIMHYCLRTGFPFSKRLLITKDTVCSFQFTDYQEIRNFAIETVYSDNSSSFSPIITVKSQETKIPQTLEISSVSVNDDEKLEIKYSISEGSSAEKLFLHRNSKTLGEETAFEISPKSGVVVDTNAVVSEVYDYSLKALNSCNVPIKESEVQNNVVLNVVQSSFGNSNILTWNPLNNFQPLEIEKTEIYRSQDGSDLQYADYVTSYYTEYNESLSNIIASSELHKGNFCYKIKILKKNQDDFVFSNLACIDLETVIYIPNALNPKSLNYDNREFKPKADFLEDYKLVVYDKKGEEVFFSDEILKGWDGYNRQGKLCVPDTYIYQISFKNSSGKIIHKNGVVNLVY